MSRGKVVAVLSTPNSDDQFKIIGEIFFENENYLEQRIEILTEKYMTFLLVNYFKKELGYKFTADECKKLRQYARNRTSDLYRCCESLYSFDEQLRFKNKMENGRRQCIDRYVDFFKNCDN